MFFFFAGGVQPRARVLDPVPRSCPRCGRSEARIKRIEPWLSLFFIPLFPVGRGATLLACGGEAASDHRFCPHCGQRL